MSSKQTGDKICRTRTIRQSGGSTVVTIPPELLEFTQFEDGDTVSLSAAFDGDEITIQKDDG